VDENEIRQRMAAYKNFYHVIRLTETSETPAVRAHVPSQEKVHRAIRSLDLEGKRVLDIGCRDGLYSFECEKRLRLFRHPSDRALRAPVVERHKPASPSDSGETPTTPLV